MSKTKNITTKPKKKGDTKVPPSVVKVSAFKLNDHNPRYIRDSRFEKLCKSISEFPKMLELRPIVYDPERDSLVLGGNMRLRAIKKLGWKEVPSSYFLSSEGLTDAEKERFIIEDNIGFGEWDYDMLANGWNVEALTDWGMEMPVEIAEPEFKEYGEDTADGVNLCKCDKCGHSHAAKD